MKLAFYKFIGAISLYAFAGCEKAEEPSESLPTATVCSVATERLRVSFALSKEGIVAIEDVPVSLDQYRAFATALVKMDPDVQLKLIVDSEVDTSKVKEFTETAYGAGIKGVIFGSNVREEPDRR